MRFPNDQGIWLSNLLELLPEFNLKVFRNLQATTFMNFKKQNSLLDV
jgi:hypothetical protein